MAAAPLWMARSRMAGSRKYSLKRSVQVAPMSEWISRTVPLRGAVTFAKSSSDPLPTSMSPASIPPGGVIEAGVIDVGKGSEDDAGLDSTWRCGWRPARRFQPEGKRHRAEQCKPRFAFAPGCRQRVLLGVNLDSGGAEGGDGPFDGFGHFRRAAYAPPDSVGQPPQIFLHRRRSHDDRQQLGRDLRAA